MIEIDNKQYKTKVFGTQEWMTEDLESCDFINGSVTIQNSIFYYNWNAAMSLIGIPEGWRLPSKEDFDRLLHKLTVIEFRKEWKGTLGGYWDHSITESVDLFGHYWSSTSYTTTTNAYILDFSNYYSSSNNSVSKLLGMQIRLVRDVPAPKKVTIQDIEYETAIFGDQEWMVEDLKKCDFKDGEAGSMLLRDDKYYYNWHAATNLLNIPSGWRLPTQEDFTKLVNRIKLKGILSPWRGVLGGFGNGTSVYYAGGDGYYWSSTYNNTTAAYYLTFYSGNVTPQNFMNKYSGCAVRLVRDVVLHINNPYDSMKVTIVP